jgi:acetyltransferase-like isoleucine patch superfamily enzyme
MRPLLIGVIRRAKHDPGWTIDPAMTLAAFMALLIGAGVKATRGWFRRIGCRSVRGLTLIGRHVTLRNKGYISAGSALVIEDYVEIQGLSRQGVTFSDRVTIGRFAMIRPSGYYSGQIGEGLRVGSKTTIGPYCYIGCSGFITIGSNVMIAPRVGFFAENHNHADIERPMKFQGVTREAITIEDNCWIGSQSVILAGVTVGHDSIIAAGSVVTHSIPPFSVVGGVPARIIRSRLAPVEAVTAKRTTL